MEFLRSFFGRLVEGVRSSFRTVVGALGPRGRSQSRPSPDTELTEVSRTSPSGGDAAAPRVDREEVNLPSPVSGILVDTETSPGKVVPGVVLVVEEVTEVFRSPPPSDDITEVVTVADREVILPSPVSVFLMDAETFPGEVVSDLVPVSEEVSEVIVTPAPCSPVDRELTLPLPVPVILIDAETSPGEVVPDPVEEDPSFPTPSPLRLPARRSIRIRRPRLFLEVDPSKPTYTFGRPRA